jgi:hypothetical protein
MHATGVTLHGIPKPWYGLFVTPCLEIQIAYPNSNLVVLRILLELLSSAANSRGSMSRRDGTSFEREGAPAIAGAGAGRWERAEKTK